MFTLALTVAVGDNLIKANWREEPPRAERGADVQIPAGPTRSLPRRPMRMVRLVEQRRTRT